MARWSSGPQGDLQQIPKMPEHLFYTEGKPPHETNGYHAIRRLIANGKLKEGHILKDGRLIVQTYEGRTGGINIFYPDGVTTSFRANEYYDYDGSEYPITDNSLASAERRRYKHKMYYGQSIFDITAYVERNFMKTYLFTQRYSRVNRIGYE